MDKVRQLSSAIRSREYEKAKDLANELNDEQVAAALEGAFAQRSAPSDEEIATLVQLLPIRAFAVRNANGQTFIDVALKCSNWQRHRTRRSMRRKKEWRSSRVVPCDDQEETQGSVFLEKNETSDELKKTGRLLLDRLLSDVQQLDMRVETHWLLRLQLRDLELNDEDRKLLKDLRFNGNEYNGETLLHFACLDGCDENILFLVEDCKISLLEVNDNGMSCLQFAYESGELDAAFKAWENLRCKLPSYLELLENIDQPTVAIRQRRRRQRTQQLMHFIDPAALDDDDLSVQLFIRALKQDDHDAFHLLLDRETYSEKLRKKIMQELRADFKFRESLQVYGKNVPGWLMEIADPMDIALYADKTNMVLEFVVTRQTDIIPTCLRFITLMRHKLKVKEGKHEQLLELQRSLVSVVTNCLDALYLEADKHQEALLHEFLEGKFQSGPFQPQGPQFQHFHVGCLSGCCCKAEVSGTVEEATLLQMIAEAECNELFCTKCVSDVVERAWNEGCSLFGVAVSSALDNAPKCEWLTFTDRFYLHLFAFIAILIFMAWYVTDFSRSLTWVWPDVVVLLIYMSLLLQEIFEFLLQYHCETVYILGTPLRFPKYCTDILNMFDFGGILLALVGLCWRVALAAGAHSADSEDRKLRIYQCQCIFAAAYLLLGFRAVYLLSYFESTGPLIVMLKKLLIKDFLPFFCIVVLIVTSFGVFFFNLLMPEGDYTKRQFRRIFTIPAYMVFGFFEKDFNEKPMDAENMTIEYNQAGRIVYDYIFFFIFSCLVNIVMVNLLIALFSESVKSLKSQAYALWRRSRWQMVQEFARLGAVSPPPFAVIEYSVVVLYLSFVELKPLLGIEGERKEILFVVLSIVLFPLYLPILLIWLPFAFVFGPLLFRRWYAYDNRFAAQQGDGGNMDGRKWWKKDAEEFPEDYRKFLRFQAEVLAKCRSQLIDASDAEQGEKSVQNCLRNQQRRIAGLSFDLEEVTHHVRKLRASSRRIRRSLGD